MNGRRGSGGATAPKRRDFKTRLETGGIDCMASVGNTAEGTPRDISLGSVVSVILIVRDGEAFIGEALESVLDSDCKPLEILVIDGGSRDRTRDIAATYPLVEVVEQDTKGIANAYNMGIARTRGDPIAFISHDDIWLPNKLDRQLAYMEGHPELGFTVTLVQHFLDPGASVPAGFRRDLLERPVPGLIMEALMARKWVFDRIGLLNPAFDVSEDTDWYARAKDAAVPMAVIPELLVKKRVHGDNSSLNCPQINQHLLRAMRASIQRKKAMGRSSDDQH